MDPTTGAFVLEQNGASSQKRSTMAQAELPPTKIQKPNNAVDISQVKALSERKRILEQKLKEVNESLAKIDQAIEATTAAKAVEARALEAKLEAEEKVVEVPPPLPKAAPKAVPKAKTPTKRTPKKQTKKGNKKSSAASPARPKRQRKKSTVLKESEGASAILPPGLESCKSVVTAVMNHRFGFPFLQPVDPVALNIPDYFDVIKHPMDFGTIRTKLYAGEYENVADFAADAHLVFSNACTYNHPGTDVYVMTETLRDFFVKKMKPIEDRERKNKSKDDRNLQDIKKSVGNIQAELQHISKNGTGGSPVIDKSQVPMTKSDMRKLSATINSLSYKHLNTIIKIIQESMPNLDGGEGELEIDLNSLDTVTLRKLETFVATVKRKKSRKKSGVSSVQSQRELAKRSQEGTAKEIETVQRQIEQLRDPNHPARPIAPTTTTPIPAPSPAPTAKSPTTARPAVPAPLVSTIEEETVRVEDSSSDSDSCSDSGSSSDGSDSGSESDTESEADDKPAN